MVIPTHIFRTRDRALYVISRLELPTIKIIGDEAGISQENTRYVIGALKADSMIVNYSIAEGYRSLRSEITEFGRAELAKMTPSRITNTAETMLLLSDAAVAPISVASILEAHFSVSNRETSAMKNIYQRLWIMKRDGHIRKIDKSRSMLGAEYAITAKGLAKLEGRELENQPAIIPVIIKPVVRKKRVKDGIIIRNKGFRIESRPQL